MRSLTACQREITLTLTLTPTFTLTQVHMRSLPAKERCPWDEDTCAAAAEGGHLDILRWARQRKCKWDANTCLSSAAAGHLHVLQWARKNACPWDAAVAHEAARRGHTEIVVWAMANGLELDSYDIRGIGMAAAGEGGSVEVLQHLLDNHPSWTSAGAGPHPMLGVMTEAVGNGRVEVLQWLVDRKLLGKYEARRIALLAARRGQLHVLEWVSSNAEVVPLNKTVAMEVLEP